MKKLLLIMGTVATLTGYAINLDLVESILSDTSFSEEGRQAAIEILTEEFEELYTAIIEESDYFGPHYCNNLIYNYYQYFLKKKTKKIQKYSIS